MTRSRFLVLGSLSLVLGSLVLGACSSDKDGKLPEQEVGSSTDKLNQCALNNPCNIASKDIDGNPIPSYCFSGMGKGSPVLVCDFTKPVNGFPASFQTPGCYDQVDAFGVSAYCDVQDTPQLAHCVNPKTGAHLMCDDPTHTLVPDTSGTGGAAGAAGSSGGSGSSGAGTAGSAGSSAGSSGTSGSAGTAGTAGTAGSAGSGGSDPCSGVTVGTSCSQWGQCAHCNDVRCDSGVWTPDALSSCGNAGAAGSSGSSGSAGTAGTSGASGSSGSAGTAGTSGSSGTSGTAGSSGTSGSAGSGGSGGSAPMCPPQGSTIECKSGNPCWTQNEVCIAYDNSSKPVLHYCTDCWDGSKPYGYLLKDTETCADIQPWCTYDGTGGAAGASGTSGSSGTSGAAGSSGTSGSAGTAGTSGASGSSGTAGSAGSPAVTGLTVVWVPPTTYSPQDLQGAPAWVESGAPELWGTTASNPYGLLATLAQTGSFYSAPVNFLAGDSVVNANVKFFSAACSGTTSVAPGWHGDFGVGLCGGSRGLASPVAGKYMGKFYVYDGSTLVAVTYYDNSQDAGNPYGQYTYAMQFVVP